MAKTNRQISQYDKILQENIEAALPGLIKNILNIQVVISEELPDSLQHTKERKPDVLKKITDDKGRRYILHIEFQSGDDPYIAYRMAEYHVMLLRLYRLPVKQYVIYIGERKPKMPSKLISGNLIFKYDLISISSIDYRIFLRSENLEERMLAILGDFGKDDPVTALRKVANSIMEAANGPLDQERRKNQLQVLAQLRILVLQYIAPMDSIVSIVKENEKILNRLYKQRAVEEKSQEVVKNLLLAKRFTITEIANFVNVTEAFVRKVKKSLKVSKS